MSPLNLIYWIKLILGIFTAALCVLLGVNNILSGIVVSIAVYLVSDKILKQIFVSKVEKPSDITKTGLTIYVCAWLLFWTLLYTLLLLH